MIEYIRMVTRITMWCDRIAVYLVSKKLLILERKSGVLILLPPSLESSQHLLAETESEKKKGTSNAIQPKWVMLRSFRYPYQSIKHTHKSSKFVTARLRTSTI